MNIGLGEEHIGAEGGLRVGEVSWPGVAAESSKRETAGGVARVKHPLGRHPCHPQGETH